MKSIIRCCSLFVLSRLLISCAAPPEAAKATADLNARSRVGAPYIGTGGITKFDGGGPGGGVATLLMASAINSATDSPDKTGRDIQFRHIVRAAVESELASAGLFQYVPQSSLKGGPEPEQDGEVPFWSNKSADNFGLQCAARNGLDYVILIRGGFSIKPASGLSLKYIPNFGLSGEVRTAAGVRTGIVLKGDGGPLPGETVPKFMNTTSRSLDAVWPEYARRAAKDLVSHLAARLANRPKP